MVTLIHGSRSCKVGLRCRQTRQPPLHRQVNRQPRARAVDLRRFPWVKRLAADYAFAFGGLAPFFSGDPKDDVGMDGRDRPRPGASTRSSASWRRPSRTAAAPRRACAGPRGGRTSRPTRHRRGADRPAGGSLRRACLQPAQSHHGAQARRRCHAAARRARRGGLLDRSRRPRLGRSAFVHGPHDELECRTIALPERPAGDPVPVATIALDDQIAAALGELEQTLPATEFRDGCWPISAPPTSRAPAWPRRSVDGWSACSANAGSSSTTRRIRPPSRRSARCSRASCRRPARRRWPHRRPARISGPRIPRAGAGRGWQPGAVPSRRSAAPDPAAERSAGGRGNELRAGGARQGSGERPADSARACSPAHRPGRALPDDLLCRGPNELAYLGQLRGVYEHSACRCRSSILGPRRRWSIRPPRVSSPNISCRSRRCSPRTKGPQRTAQDPNSPRSG